MNVLFIFILFFASETFEGNPSPTPGEKTRFINFLQPSQEETKIHIAKAIAIGQEGLPLATHRFQDLHHFHELAQISFSQNSNNSQLFLSQNNKPQNFPLYTISPQSTASLKELENLLRRDSWIEFEIEQSKDDDDGDNWSSLLSSLVTTRFARKPAKTRFRIPIGVHGHLYSHYTFSCLYDANRGQIISVQVVGSLLKEIDHLLGSEIQVTCHVDWTLVNSEIEKFLALRERNSILYLVNSLIMLGLLVGLVVFLGVKGSIGGNGDFNSNIFGLDFQASLVGKFGQETLSDYGWKAVYADVFKEPFALGLLGIFLACGVQCIMAILLLWIGFAVFRFDDAKEGSWNFIFPFSLAAGFGGMSSGCVMRSFGASQSMIKSAALFNGVLQVAILLISSLVETLISSAMNSSLSKNSFGNSLMNLLALICFNAPLYYTGSMLPISIAFPGRSSCSTKERKIHSRSFGNWIAFMLPCAIIPCFSLWKEAIVFDFFSISLRTIQAFLIALALASCCAIISTFALLNCENHKWQWNSVICGGSSGLFLGFLLVSRAFVQISCFSPVEFAFFIAKVSMISVVLFCALGTAGYLASQTFLVLLYRSLKFD